MILYSDNKMANTQFQDFMYVNLSICILKLLNIYLFIVAHFHAEPCIFALADKKYNLCQRW
jgi:hypothetical protein